MCEKKPKAGYLIEVRVKEVRGFCALGYRSGESFIIDRYFVPEGQKTRICIHALNSMLTLLMPFLQACCNGGGKAISSK